MKIIHFDQVTLDMMTKFCHFTDGRSSFTQPVNYKNEATSIFRSRLESIVGIIINYQHDNERYRDN